MARKWYLLFLLASFFPLFAQLSANLAATNDYVWRGVSQSDEDPALQGGLDYAFENGFSLGAWGSNVAFDGDKDVEYDLYGSWSHELENGFSYELGYIYYGYRDLDYSDEGFFGVGFKDFSAKLWKGIEVDWLYLEGGYEREIFDGFQLGLHVGKYDYDEGEDYMDYKIAVTKELFGLEWELAYTDTDLDAEAADGRAVLLVRKVWSFE